MINASFQCRGQNRGVKSSREKGADLLFGFEVFFFVTVFAMARKDKPATLF